MRAKGRSPTSAIAPPASIENHASGQSPSQISMKLLGCQQSQIGTKFTGRLTLSPEVVNLRVIVQDTGSGAIGTLTIPIKKYVDGMASLGATPPPAPKP